MIWRTFSIKNCLSKFKRLLNTDFRSYDLVTSLIGSYYRNMYKIPNSLSQPEKLNMKNDSVDVQELIQMIPSYDIFQSKTVRRHSKDS